VKLSHIKREEAQAIPKKMCASSVETICVSGDSVLLAAKDTGVVHAQLAENGASFDFKEVYLVGRAAEKSLKFDPFSASSKFYALTNAHEVLYVELGSASKTPEHIRLNTTQPNEIALNTLMPNVGAVIDSQGVVEM